MKKGFGVIEVLLVSGLVAAGGMLLKYTSDVKKSGKQESELEMHENNIETRKKANEDLKAFQIQQERFNIEDREMKSKKVSPKERNKKALERWGK